MSCFRFSGWVPGLLLIGFVGAAGADTNACLTATEEDYVVNCAPPLASGHVALRVCTNHFPVNSPAWKEVEKAAAAYNGLKGVDLAITLVPARHHEIKDLYHPRPDYSIIDYLDNRAEDIPSHRAGDVGRWAMNSTRDDAEGEPPRHFVIAVNTHAYGSPQRPYPRYDGIVHELGHAFGMRHMKFHADKRMISVMAGNPDILSAFDIGFLRRHYPDPGGYRGINLVASPDVRVPARNANGYHTSAAIVPASLRWNDARQAYMDGDILQAPYFAFAWYNVGNLPADRVFSNRLTIGGVEVHAWESGPMPAESQDGREWLLPVPKLEGLKPGEIYEIAVELDAKQDVAEDDEQDNRRVLGRVRLLE